MTGPARRAVTKATEAASARKCSRLLLMESPPICPPPFFVSLWKQRETDEMVETETARAADQLYFYSSSHRSLEKNLELYILLYRKKMVSQIIHLF